MVRGQTALWFAIHVPFYTVASYAVVTGTPWARNLTVFLVWVAFALGVLSAVAFSLVSVQFDHDQAVPVESIPDRRSVPLWLSLPLDIAFVLLLAAYGWFWSAAAWSIGEAFSSIGISTGLAVRRKHDAKMKAALR